VTPIASHADREPDRIVSGTPTATSPHCTIRRSHAGSMSPASAHAGQITNGGTATDPKGVPSFASRIGGRPGAPMESHSRRRPSIESNVGTAKTRTGTAVTSPTHAGRSRMQRSATGSIAANATIAASARRLMPKFSADAVAIATDASNSRIGTSSGVRGTGLPRSARCPTPRIAPMAMR
jgi:hypothetical protein